MAKKKKGGKRRHKSSVFSGFGGLGATVSKLTSKVPKQVTRPLYFIGGIAAGRFVATQVDKYAKVTPKADGEKFSIKTDYKQLIAPAVNIGLGVALSTVGAKKFGEVAEYAGYGFITSGVGSGVKRVFSKNFLGLGETEFDGTGKTELPASREEADAAMRALKAAAERDGKFLPPGGSKEEVVDGLGNMFGGGNWKRTGMQERVAFDDAEDADERVI